LPVDRLLSNAYREFCRSRSWEPRTLLYEGLDELDESLSKREPALLILDLPTAYGKTTITPALAQTLFGSDGLFSRIIHVLPMRSIADQLGADVKKIVPQEMVAIQHLGSHGSPFFAKKIVIITLDSFVLNFFKAPAVELPKLIKYDIAHFEFPRGMIYSSLVIFDEFHLFSPLGTQEQSVKSLTSAIYAVTTLSSAGLPVIVMTATIPEKLKQLLKSKINSAGVEVIDKVYATGVDKKFDEEQQKKCITIRIENGTRIKELCKQHLEKNDKVMVVFNTPKKAVEAYYSLSEYNPILLHGNLPEGKRWERMELLDTIEKTPRLLIATQVVESGLNLSFDALITEACPADRLIQRAGRVARAKGHDIGRIYFLEPQVGEEYPYSETLVERTLKRLKTEPKLSKEMIDSVYSDENVSPNADFWRTLSFLDLFPKFGGNYAKKALEAYRGFTDAFGIVNGYMNNNICKDMAIGLSEREAKKELVAHRKLVKNEKGSDVSKMELNEVLYQGCISIQLLARGCDGIVICDFDPEVGYLGCTNR
jgi:CRISPR-associated endonuclease/helicase Cas3